MLRRGRRVLGAQGGRRSTRRNSLIFVARAAESQSAGILFDTYAAATRDELGRCQ